MGEGRPSRKVRRLMGWEGTGDEYMSASNEERRQVSTSGVNTKIRTRGEGKRKE